MYKSQKKFHRYKRQTWRRFNLPSSIVQRKHGIWEIEEWCAANLGARGIRWRRIIINEGMFRFQTILIPYGDDESIVKFSLRWVGLE